MKYAPALCTLVACLALAACGSEIPDDRDESLTQTTPLPSPSLPAGSIERTTLVPGVISPGLQEQRGLDGDLGCVFRRGEEMLFASIANAASLENAQGLVVIDGEPIELAMEGEGGYNALARGARFSGPDNLTVSFDISEAAAAEDQEAPVTGPPPKEAMMQIARAGKSLSVEGIYECGTQGDP